MRLRKSENRWSFKGGWGGPVFRLESNLKPNQITWRGYSSDGTNWIGGDQIDGTLYYIVYK